MSPNASSQVYIVERDLSHSIVGAFFEVYNELGFGFVESVYARALQVALTARGHVVEREYPVTILFRGVQVGQHRLDMLVDRKVVIEIKSTEKLADTPKRQLRDYLAAMGLELGILLHFGPKAEFHRILHRVHQRSHSANSANAANSDE